MSLLPGIKLSSGSYLLLYKYCSPPLLLFFFPLIPVHLRLTIVTFHSLLSLLSLLPLSLSLLSLSSRSFFLSLSPSRLPCPLSYSFVAYPCLFYSCLLSRSHSSPPLAHLHPLSVLVPRSRNLLATPQTPKRVAVQETAAMPPTVPSSTTSSATLRFCEGVKRRKRSLRPRRIAPLALRLDLSVCDGQSTRRLIVLFAPLKLYPHHVGWLHRCHADDTSTAAPVIRSGRNVISCHAPPLQARAQQQDRCLGAG